jgi:hypothetical protein
MFNISNRNLTVVLPIIQPVEINDIIAESYFTSYRKKRTISLIQLKEEEAEKINLAYLIMNNVINKKTRNKFSINTNLINILNIFYK